MRKIIIVLICIGILVSWHICQSDMANAWDKSHRCSFAGIWLGVNQNGEEMISNVTPLDAWGKRFYVIGEGLHAYDPSFGYLPEDTQVSKFYGIIERIGPGMHEATFYQYGVSPTVGKLWKVSAYQTYKRVDCDHVVGEGTISFFLFDEKGNEIPSGCIPTSGTSERLTLEPPCE